MHQFLAVNDQLHFLRKQKFVGEILLKEAVEFFLVVVVVDVV